jgi:hypothetical protein
VSTESYSTTIFLPSSVSTICIARCFLIMSSIALQIALSPPKPSHGHRHDDYHKSQREDSTASQRASSSRSRTLISNTVSAPWLAFLGPLSRPFLLHTSRCSRSLRARTTLPTIIHVLDSGSLYLLSKFNGV